MKIKNQSSIPSKYWLAIIAVICVILLGIDQVTDGGDRFDLSVIIQLFQCRKVSAMLEDG